MKLFLSFSLSLAHSPLIFIIDEIIISGITSFFSSVVWGFCLLLFLAFEFIDIYLCILKFELLFFFPFFANNIDFFVVRFLFFFLRRTKTNNNTSTITAICENNTWFRQNAVAANLLRGAISQDLIWRNFLASIIIIIVVVVIFVVVGSIFLFSFLIKCVILIEDISLRFLAPENKRFRLRI